MKRVLVLFVFAVLLCGITSCSSASMEPTETKAVDFKTDEVISDAENEQPCKHEYKEEVYKEPGYGVEGLSVKYCVLCGETEYCPIPALPDAFQLRVSGRKVHLKEKENGRDCFVAFVMEITNISDKTIKSISGVLSIVTPNTTLDLTCDFPDLDINPDETEIINRYGYTFDYDFDIHSAEYQVFETSFEELEFTFTPTEVSVEERKDK